MFLSKIKAGSIKPGEAGPAVNNSPPKTAPAKESDSDSSSDAHSEEAPKAMDSPSLDKYEPSAKSTDTVYRKVAPKVECRPKPELKPKYLKETFLEKMILTPPKNV